MEQYLTTIQTKYKGSFDRVYKNNARQSALVIPVLVVLALIIQRLLLKHCLASYIKNRNILRNYFTK